MRRDALPLIATALLVLPLGACQVRHHKSESIWDFHDSNTANGGTIDHVVIGDRDLDNGSSIGAADTRLDSFGSLVMAGRDNVVVTPGNGFAIRADGPADVLATLRFRRKGDELLVGRRSGATPDASATIHITAPELHAITMAGTGNGTVARLTGDKAEATVAGAGNLSLATVAAGTLNASIGGAGSIAAAGTAKKLDLAIGGSGNVNAAGLHVGDADVTIAGTGNVAFASDGTVDGTIAGTGTITVTGKAHCTVTTLGPGSVHCG